MKCYSKSLIAVFIMFLSLFLFASFAQAQAGDNDRPIFNSLQLSSNQATPDQPVTITADVTPPILKSLNISSITAKAGDSVTITADVYDESGYISVFGNYKPINSTRYYDKSFALNLNEKGNYSGSIRFEANDDKGVYILDQLYLSDLFGNQYTIRHSKTNSEETANYRYEDLSRYFIYYDATVPMWPSDNVLTVTNSTYTSADLQWQHAVSLYEINHYNIYKDGNRIDTVSGNVYKYHVDGLSQGGSYRFMVEANNEWGNSINNPTTTVTTGVYFDTTPPYWNPGAKLTVTEASYKSIKLSWDPAHDNVGVKQYLIYSDGAHYATLDSSITSYNIYNLVPNSIIRFEVKAMDYAGNITNHGLAIIYKVPDVISTSPEAYFETNGEFIQAGSTFDVNIGVKDAVDLYGFLLKLDYDPNMFEIEQIELHSEFGSENVDAIVGRNEPGAAQFDLTGVLLGNVQGKYGNIKLVTVKLNALRNGNGSLSLSSESQISDSKGQLTMLNPVSFSIHVGDLDFNRDGQVNLSDLVIISHYNDVRMGNPLYDPLFDLNNDGVIDKKDIQYVADKIVKKN
ncbi:fibronectin type III domain-containing protein [Paenibacillus sp. OAS669]|uniref:fibronectin type III domain-containing protein n=1 Tax=Paenibacillus sp. OAS669 TaxID=2663821 RepID=UPI0017890BDF|nr:cohesin domain-containing protein [Paenibacillus sp. OAS669]MBE1445475.1 hypothetical protein [Paenibacillus sp. OAS669]